MQHYTQILQLREKVIAGMRRMVSLNEEKDTVNASAYMIDRNGNLKSIHGNQYKWTDESISYLPDALADYLLVKGVRMKPEKHTLIDDHLQNFVAYKSAIFSSYPPSPELAEVIAVQIGRAIEWANRDEVVYPNGQQRNEAKTQIDQILRSVQSYMVQLVNEPVLSQFIQHEIQILQQGFDWRTDSPFFTIGKKVFTRQELADIEQNCQKVCSNQFDGEKLQPDSNGNADHFSPEINRQKQLAYLRTVIHQSLEPMCSAYLISANRVYSKEETSHEIELLKQMRWRN